MIPFIGQIYESQYDPTLSVPEMIAGSLIVIEFVRVHPFPLVISTE